MIDARTAVEIARKKAAEMIGAGQFPLEEIERIKYRNRDTWDITLSIPRELVGTSRPALGMVLSGPASVVYKRFLIDAASGDLIAIKIREAAFQ